jgi:tetratricopeptide (TPR) repeat protein
MLASIDLELMRASMLLETDPAAAARLAGAVLKAQPGHDAATLLLTTACRRLGDSASAVDIMEALGKLQPDAALIQLELGRTYAACGRVAEGIAALEQALKLDQTLVDAWSEVSKLHLLAGRTGAADAAYIKYRRLAGNPAELSDAYRAFDLGQLPAAELEARKVLRSGGSPVAALTLLAAIASRRGDDLGEELALDQILAQAPCDNAAREQLAQLQLRQGRTEEALKLIERLLVAQPRGRSLLILKAEALELAERPAEALQVIEDLLAEHPNDADLFVIAGNQRRYSGQTREAIAAYRHALELQPGNGLAYWALANLDALDSPSIVETLQQQLTAAAPAGYDATCFEFALGKTLEDRGDYAASFEHYERGNRRARAAFHYDATANTAFVHRFKATFTRQFFEQRAGWGSPAADPIFIVGLPRSGSTLLEQILAGHSQIEGTRELPHLPALARELAGLPETAARYPENVAALTRSDVGALAQRYLASARPHRLRALPRFIDKMHGNFASLGIIHLMFPRATIVDARRHPLGCGFGCYKQLFSAGMNFAYDLGELGLYYRDYAALMDHIDSVLPGRVHRVHYEQLVADDEREVRRLLDACGLAFEPQCLRFHELERVAQTVSSQQVRRPIYTQGVDQWRHYERWLGPLKAVLGNLVDEYPAAFLRRR